MNQWLTYMTKQSLLTPRLVIFVWHNAGPSKPSVRRREEGGCQRQTRPGGTLKARQPGDRQAGESGDPVTVLKERITSGNFYLQGSDGPWSPVHTAEQQSPSGSHSLHASVRPGCRSAGKQGLRSWILGKLERVASLFSTKPPIWQSPVN